MVRIMERVKNPKWDSLYDAEHKSFFSKFEEFLINNYFSKVFTSSILKASKSKSGKIFEPGSGGGMASATLAKQGFELTCMDLSKNALVKNQSLFKEQSLDGKYILGDIFHLPISNNKFDIVFNQGVMEHFRLEGMNPSVAVNEMFRIVKKNGTLIIFVPAYYSPLFFVYRIMKGLNLIDKYWPYADQDFLHKHELFDMMKKTGAKKIKIQRVWSSFFFSLIGYCKKTD